MGLKPRSRSESALCEKCGALFEATIWIRPDDTETTPDKLCKECQEECRKQERIERKKLELEEERDKQLECWFNTYGVEGIFMDKTFDDFKGELQRRAFEAVKNLKDKSLVLLSPGVYGVGKTHLVCALANHLVGTEDSVRLIADNRIIRRHCPVYFTTESKLLAKIRQTYNRTDDNTETDGEIYSGLHQYPLLIIDDVGKVRPRDYSFLQGVYFNLIDGRYVEEKNIILTTNLDFRELEEHIGGASADRLREMCGKEGFIVMKGQSYRR